MQTAMVVTWSHPFPGREMKALEYGAEVASFWSQQAAEGKCTQPEMFLGSTGRGMWMVKGEQQTLLEITAGDTSQRLLATGALLLAGFGYEWMLTGDAADASLGLFASLVPQLGLAQ